VQFPCLSVTELKVFQACLAWSSKECHRRGIPVTPDNQRSVLGSVLSHIRFPTMTLMEFAQDVSKTNVLTTDDRCAVFEYIACRSDACACCDKQVRIRNIFTYSILCKPVPVLLFKYVSVM